MSLKLLRQQLRKKNKKSWLMR